jgi:hypothetical protein
VPIGKDSVAWEAAYGQGADRYVNSDGAPPATVLTDQASASGARHLHTESSWLVMANYTHFWTDTLRSNIAGSYWKQNNKAQNFSASSANFSTLFKDTYTLHVNLIWSPVPQTNFGIEYMRMGATEENNRKGTFDRVQVSAQFKF